MYFDVIIVGAGPAGLSCALKLASSELSVLVLERSQQIGHKVCAGGITWSGLLRLVPEALIEKSFPVQHVRSILQKIHVSEQYPIIATVNRKRLGRYMAAEAIKNGIEIRTSCILRKVEANRIVVYDREAEKLEEISFSFLVGADGSSSSVRRYLKIPTHKVGIGVNFQIHGSYDKMEWHLDQRYFKNGYGWVFPHKNTISIGAYAARNVLGALDLKNRLCKWADARGIILNDHRCEAGLINYDYKGWDYGNIFLVGDAAGMASALTGEGIYPAILSGEAAADKIISPGCDQACMDKLIAKHHKFSRAVELTSKSGLFSAFAAELGVLMLRAGILDFTKLEMG